MQEFFPSKPRIGISACLLGQKVRYDGGDKRDRFLTDIFGLYVEWIPVCPEVEVGMGIPRKPVRLVGNPTDPRMIAERSGDDWTLKMNQYASQRTPSLTQLDLSGYILKKNSPSCGMERVRIYGLNGTPARQGRGLFAAVLMRRCRSCPLKRKEDSTTRACVKISLNGSSRITDGDN